MRLNDKIEKEINRFISYIRRMNSFTDDKQLETLLTIAYNNNTDSYTSLGVDLAGHVQFIREMGKYSDDQLKHNLRKKYQTDLIYQDIFENSSKKKAIKETIELAKDMHTDPRTFARKVA